MSTRPVIIITGASAGIGSAIVSTLLLLTPPPHLLLIDISEPPLLALQSTHGIETVQYIVGDVSQDDTNTSAVKRAIDTWGRLDAVVLNAGIMAPVHRLAGADPEKWRHIMAVNVVAHVSLLSSAIPHLRNSSGRAIFTTSDAGDRPTFPAWGAYGASKAAVNYLIRVLALEEPSITSVGIYPGVVDTPMVRGIFAGEYSAGMSEEDLRVYKEVVGKRIVKAEEPGGVIARLAVGAEKELRGEVRFWDDVVLESYR